MSPATLDLAEAQWHAQFAAMRAALADLKLPSKDNGETESYGSELSFNDDEFTSGNSGDDVWDFISDSDEDAWSDAHEEPVPEDDGPTSGYGPQWLKSKCIGFAARKQG